MDPIGISHYMFFVIGAALSNFVTCKLDLAGCY